MQTELQKIIRLGEVEELMGVLAGIFEKLGFKNQSASRGDDRQIVFDNLIFVKNGSLSLSVVVLGSIGNLNSRTFNFEFRNLPGQSSSLTLQDREIKSVVIQLVESQNYKQLSFQVYFEVPLSYQGEDLVFRVKVNQTSTGPKLIIGFPWIKAQTHLSSAAVLKLAQKISLLFDTPS
ncbi:hypothetical protein HYS82_03810 [Candidatus Amesbacteria bacterium]|nr:hypothetical protein [Candidatus Amesbacteria bacterium]MBI2587405.1 hypothetical protein [Candidatus Amesbacteria bacterium]